ncbi:hypothetical protein KYN89_13150 [Alteriqipengyuania sp. NZ-12B]|uniref:DUF4276 family protein n=1 Tax=Alteriqipengyuania abyssalis TaxID=2860200 RepID=A0ABS7PG95_9SPHN|nr:hypothetical protein [Alteriqipengyuania abyssalis]MBY8337991.1 hypothetical protein [Alteriqipengyuania abyssalis]
MAKKLIIVSEDKETKFLKKLVSQWPELDRQVTVLPGRGYKHLLSKSEAEELRSSLGNKFKLLVHRDRDSLTDNEVERLKNEYDDESIRLWFTEQSDLEAEFCSADFLMSLLGISRQEADDFIERALNRNTGPIREQFENQRRAHNQELWAAGGSPTNDDVWDSMQHRRLRGAKGKFVFNQLKNVIGQNLFSDDIVIGCENFPEQAVGLARNIRDLLAD